MTLHSLFGTHVPDLKASGWTQGRFVTPCAICGAQMVKPPGGVWKLVPRAERPDTPR